MAWYEGTLCSLREISKKQKQTNKQKTSWKLENIVWKLENIVTTIFYIKCKHCFLKLLANEKHICIFFQFGWYIDWKSDHNVAHSSETSHNCQKIICQICWWSKCWSLKWYFACRIHSTWSFTHEKPIFILKIPCVFYCFVTCLLACISKSVLWTYGRFCGSGSHIYSSLRKVHFPMIILAVML